MLFNINTKEQRRRFNAITKNLSEEDLEVVTNWGGELYNNGFVKGALLCSGCIILGVCLTNIIVERRNKEGG